MRKNEDEGLFVDDFLHFAVQEYTALLNGFSKTELCIW